MAAGNGRADSYQQASAASGQGHGSMMPYPPSPGSPTLTNPDMILPEDEHPSSPDRSQSPLFIWKGPVSINDMQYHMPLQSSFNNGPPLTPTTPIIYGNGTMLSDIGEVTEVESNVGGRAPSRLSSPAPPFYNSTNDAALGSSPTMGAHGGSVTAGTKTIIKTRSKTATRQRSDSIDSSSTITSRGRPAPFADFDDAVSVDDSVFQGDDEESMAESYVDDGSVQPARLRPRGSGSELDEENRFSTSSIGRRAELILANAKRRLTVCLRFTVTTYQVSFTWCFLLVLTIVYRPWRAIYRKLGQLFMLILPSHPMARPRSHPHPLPRPMAPRAIQTRHRRNSAIRGCRAIT